MKSLILFFCSCFICAELSAQTTIAIKPQLKSVTFPDSVTSYSVVWTVDSVFVEGLKDCIHNFETAPGSEQQKQFLDAKGIVSDSLAQIYNPNRERMIQVICSKCGRWESRSENILILKKVNPLKAFIKN